VRRLVLSLALSSLVLLATASTALAAHRTDDGATGTAIGGTAVARWAGGMNARLVFINEAVAPDSTSYDPAPVLGGVRRGDHAERLLL
jgi:hypothetical protein